MKAVLVPFLSIVFLLPNLAIGQDDLPAWVPKDALLAARRHWEHSIERYNLRSLKHEFGLNSIDDALSCELRNPYKVIRIEYESYEGGRNILDSCVSPRNVFNNAYGFGIYRNDKLVGDISVFYRDGSWEFMEMRSYGSKKGYDLFGPIFHKYPISAGYKIYRDWLGAFFVFKDNNAVQAFQFGLEDGKYHETKPEEYMQKQRARLLDLKKDCN